MQSASMPCCSIKPLKNRASNVRPISTPKKDILESKTSLKSKVSSILSSCRICLSSIFNAAALTCGHRFCERCLSQYWRVKKKPDNMICPLCRSCSFNIDFAKVVENPSTEEFRRAFNPVQIEEDGEAIEIVLWTVKITVLMPVLFYLIKWLMPYVVYFYGIYMSERD